jgi:hypothetical protein
MAVQGAGPPFAYAAALVSFAAQLRKNVVSTGKSIKLTSFASCGG